MAKDSCGAVFSRDVALAGSDIASAFICVRTSKSCGGGNVDSVCEMASVALRLGGRSTPEGKGGRAFAAGFWNPSATGAAV